MGNVGNEAGGPERRDDFLLDIPHPGLLDQIDRLVLETAVQESAQPAFALAAALHDEFSREVGVVDPLAHAGHLWINPFRYEHLRHLFHREVVTPDVDLAHDKDLLQLIKAALQCNSGESDRCPPELPVERFGIRLESTEHIPPDGPEE